MIYKDARVCDILAKAIDKAVDNGFMVDVLEATKPETIKIVKNQLKYIHADQDSDTDPESLIFDHDFAKALWGEDILFSNPEGKGYIGAKGIVLSGHAYQYHLQQMVLSEDPIAYLAKYI
jgi:hypothetical protein